MKFLANPTLFIFLLSSISLGQDQLGSDIDGEAGSDRSGFSVSLSSNGDRVAIGALQNGGNGSNSGHVRVYSWSGSSWTQLGSDIDGEAAGDYSGRSVSMNSDGDRVAIGATGNDGNGSNSGHVRVYSWDGSSWTQLGPDIDGENAGDNFGYSVSMNSDGDRVAIGAIYNDGTASNAGHVRVYSWNGSSWVQLGSDIDGEAGSDTFGASVSINSNGSRVAIGAYLNDGNGTNSGHVRVYSWDGSSWTQMGSDIDGEATDDYCGFSVSMNSDGDRVVIGSIRNDGNGSNAGHARVFSWNGSSWTQLGSNIDGETEEDNFGRGVSINSNGDRLAVGAIYNDGNGSNAGHVRVFSWNGSSWAQLGSDIDAEAAGDNFGFSVSMNAYGDKIAVGARNNNSSGAFGGHVRVYNSFAAKVSGDAGFRMMASPVSGQVLGELLTNAWTQGMTGADVTGASANVWTFDLAGQSWTALSDISGSGTFIAAGQGFLTYVFADNNNDGTADLPITLSVSGSENSGSATYPASGSIAANAYGLAGNPYYSTIDWDDVTKTNVTSTAYVWDDGAGASGAYKSWNGSTGGLTDGLIAPYQGFWVQANGSGSGSITIEEADKSSSAGTFYRIADIEESGSLSLTFASTGNKQDVAWFSFTEDGEMHKDDKDAYKLLPLAASSRIAAMSYNNESSLDINNLPYSQDQAFEVPLDVMSLEVEESNFITIENDITVSWDVDNLPMHVEMILIDQVTGTQINIRDQYSYTFTTQPKGSFSTSYSGPVGTYPALGEARFSLLVSYDALTSGGTIKMLPAEFALHAAYPNPFNPSTTISFDLPEAGTVSLNVYDLKGALVGTLLNENKVAGSYQYRWTPSNELASGMYLFELKTKNKTSHQKITYIK
jgi:hypothetical protein